MWKAAGKNKGKGVARHKEPSMVETANKFVGLENEDSALPHTVTSIKPHQDKNTVVDRKGNVPHYPVHLKGAEAAQ